jgi:hypothetical protein
MKTKITKLAIGVMMLALIAAPRFAAAAVVVAEPTGDADPAFLAELKASLETVAAEAAPDVNGELKSSAVNTVAGVELVVEYVPFIGAEPIRETRTASRASALAQARAMGRGAIRSLVEPEPVLSVASKQAEVTPPMVVEIAAPPAPPRPALPRPPTKFRMESTAFAGLFWIGDVKKPTGGLDFGVGWSFADRVGLGVRLAISWVLLDCSCTDGECGPILSDSQREHSNDDTYSEDYETRVYKDLGLTFLTFGFDLSLGDTDLFYVDILAGVRSALPVAGVEEMALPFPYVALGFTLTPLRHEHVALLLRIDVGYYTLAAIFSPAEDKGLEPHGAVGIQF